MAEESKETKETKESKGGPLDNKIVLLGIIVALQAVMAVGIIQFVIGPKLAALGDSVNMPVVLEAVEGEGVIVGLNEMVVTLNDGSRRQSYLKITIDLEVSDQSTADIVTARMPQLRDVAILALSNKSSADLGSGDGKAALKAELHRKLGDVLPEGKLTSVYFSDMVVQ
jgi:flagellar basal body-associated protein FliL